MKQRISALAPRARPGAQIASSADGACGRRSRLAQNHGTEYPVRATSGHCQVDPSEDHGIQLV